MSKRWTVADVWNNSIMRASDRAPAPRDYIWGSELGMPPIDIYLRLKGTTLTNPPNMRSMRKFSAGDTWEFVLGLILTRAGLVIETQRRAEYQYNGLLKVTGKSDFICGGVPNFEKAIHELESLHLPDWLQQASFNIVEKLKNEIGDTNLKEIVIECKSVSTMMYERYERISAAPNHKLQLFHYLKSYNIDEGHIFYICKDDCRLLEIPIFNPSDTEIDYIKEITLLTDAINSGKQPQKELEVKFNDKVFKFEKNWGVEYSGFLTMLYGYATPEDYRLKYDKIISSANRVYKRCVAGSNMTKLNLQVIEETKKIFPHFDELVDMGKAHKDQIPLEEEEIESV